MNFFNRAIKNITRKISKTILLAITFFVIGNFVIIGLSVATASNSAKTLTRQKMRAVVTYQIDYDAVWKYTDSIEDEDELNDFYQNKYPKITYSDVNLVLQDPRVKTANVSNTRSFYTTEGGIDYVHLNNEYEQSDASRGTSCYWNEETNSQVCHEYVDPKFYARGNFFPSIIEIEDGDFKIIEGRFYSAEDIKNYSKVVLVTEALAKQNNLSVGDTITIRTRDMYPEYEKMGITEDMLSSELEVIGIYSHNHPMTPDNENFNWTSPMENFDNLLLMPGSTMNALDIELQQREWDYYKELYPDDEYYQNEKYKPSAEKLDDINLYDVTLLLNDPLEVDDFVEEYKGKLGEFKTINANNEEFEKLAKPLDTLSDYAVFIVWLVVINAIIIISLVTALTLKTREYEIGVLLSIGASKLKIVLQFFVELALVAIVGFTLAVGSGSIISNKIGTVLLDNQIESSGIKEEDDYYYYDDSIWNTDYTTKVSLDDILAEYDVVVSPVIIGEIYVVGLAIVMISVIIPSIMIMRFNPKKILMNQQ